MRNFLYNMRGAAIAALFALMATSLCVTAQQFILDGVGVRGFLYYSGKQPTATGCTVAAGSTDAAGSCTATAAAGSIVFAKTDLVNAPLCVVVDASATPIMVYTVTPLQITLTTITSAHIIRWNCGGQAGL